MTNYSLNYSSQTVSLALGILVAWLMYQVWTGGFKDEEAFVPYNSFVVPDEPQTVKTTSEASSEDKTVNLVARVNAATWSLPYNMSDLTSALEEALNSLGLGKFKVSSVGSKGNFSLARVIVMDKESQWPMAFERVDFMLNSLNPFLLDKILITPAMKGQGGPKALSETVDNHVFRIKNKLGLFYPYPTSDNDMAISPDTIAEHIKTVKAKEEEARILAESQPTVMGPQALI